MTENNLRGKGLFHLSACSPLDPGKPGQELKDRRQRLVKRAGSTVHWLVLFDLLNLHSYTDQDHLLRYSTVHNRLGRSPTSIINHENVPGVNLVGACFQLKFPFCK